MKYWVKGKYGDGTGISLKGVEDDRILSVWKHEERIVFREECDQYFNETYSKEDALKLIDELREWIEDK